jgi:hypothetical protein
MAAETFEYGSTCLLESSITFSLSDDDDGDDADIIIVDCGWTRTLAIFFTLFSVLAEATASRRKAAILLFAAYRLVRALVVDDCGFTVFWAISEAASRRTAETLLFACLCLVRTLVDDADTVDGDGSTCTTLESSVAF